DGGGFRQRRCGRKADGGGQPYPLDSNRDRAFKPVHLHLRAEHNVGIAHTLAITRIPHPASPAAATATQPVTHGPYLITESPHTRISPAKTASVRSRK